MRVAVVASGYRVSNLSGERLSTAAQLEARRLMGLNVDFYERITDDEIERRGKLKYKTWAALQTLILSDGALATAINDTKPDIVHVHNLFPNFAPRFLGRIEAPTVMTHHNFRYTCANGTLFRAESQCTECLDRSTLSSLIHGCYHSSRLQTLPIFLGGTSSVSRSPSIRAVRMHIFHSQRDAKIALRAGVPSHKIETLHNFVHIGRTTLYGRNRPREGFLFGGRNTPEKGLRELLSIWPNAASLSIAGPVDLNTILNRGSNINFRGSVPHESMLRLASGVQATVIPSLWKENGFPRIALESLSLGTPIVACEGNAAADLIKEFDVGRTFDIQSEQSLREALNTVSHVDPEHCRSVYQSHFSRGVWQKGIMRLYDQVIGSSNG